MSLGGTELRKKLSALGDGPDVGLRPAEALLLMAELLSPRRAAGPYLRKLTAFGAELSTLLGPILPPAPVQASLLAEFLCRRHGYSGFAAGHEDEGGGDLMAVLDGRQGGSLLALLALDVARRAGMEAELLSFPAVLLLRIQDTNGQRVMVDPAQGCNRLESQDLRALLKAVAGVEAELEAAHFQPLGNRAVVLRLVNEAKQRHLRLGEVEQALGLVEAILLLAPDESVLWREAGLMHLRLDDPGGAVAALEQFVARTPNALARARAEALLADLKSRLI